MLNLGDIVKVRGRFWAIAGVASDTKTGTEYAVLEKGNKRKLVEWHKIDLTQPSDWITV